MAKAPKAKAGPTAAEVMARLDALEGENRSLRSTNMALMSQAPVTQAIAAPPREVDLKGLPNPVDNPTEYATELAKRVSAHTTAVVNHSTQTVNTQQTNKQRVDNLFNDFAAKFPELAKNRDQLEFIAQKVVGRAKASGMDAEKYMFTAKDQFFADVDAEFKKVFPVAAPAAVVAANDDPVIDDGDPAAQAAKPAATVGEALEAEDDEDDGRSTGIFGGAESGNRQSAPGRSAAEVAARKKSGIVEGDMIDDLQNVQRKSGFF